MNFKECDAKLGKLFSSFAPIFLRLVLGIMFLFAGIGKLGGIEGLTGMLSWLGPLAGFFAWVVAIVELLGGAFLILGLFTRKSSLLLGIIMLVAAITVGIPNGFMGALRGDIMYLAGLMILLAYGPGKLSLDGMFFKK